MLFRSLHLCTVLEDFEISTDAPCVLSTGQRRYRTQDMGARYTGWPRYVHRIDTHLHRIYHTHRQTGHLSGDMAISTITLAQSSVLGSLMLFQVVVSIGVLFRDAVWHSGALGFLSL